jgi:hypothetical protein
MPALASGNAFAKAGKGVIRGMKSAIGALARLIRVRLLGSGHRSSISARAHDAS